MDEKELIKRGLKKKDLAHRQADRVNHKEMEEKRYGAIKKRILISG